MAQDIVLNGQTYYGVPAIHLPTTSGGTVAFADVASVTATPEQVRLGKVFYDSSGNRQVGQSYGLLRAYFEGKISYLSHSTLNVVSSFAFPYASELVSVDFPMVLSIGWQAFTSCPALETVSVPRCSVFLDLAFGGCVSLKSLTISCEAYFRSVWTDRPPFEECINLSNVFIAYGESDTVINMSLSSLFNYTPMFDSSYLGYYGTFYVPISTVESYKAQYVGYESNFVGV